MSWYPRSFRVATALSAATLATALGSADAASAAGAAPAAAYAVGPITDVSACAGEPPGFAAFLPGWRWLSLA